MTFNPTEHNFSSKTYFPVYIRSIHTLRYYFALSSPVTVFRSAVIAEALWETDSLTHSLQVPINIINTLDTGHIDFIIYLQKI